ncbi:hypothetical protein SAMN04515647_1670 [Cohaesibacter sp. ES.047]|uniref:hypothetical protein n=1 Tax=Cohaesibacter sp. ES.047 TaxID=1798205 RepID=UPI000BB71C09|nr:hypothetical protein [Cohaesibacter sp. ES.047]SNY91448.1 hypothetical protein SAMN04515647_1670 [Cohaesibacter sp. ES.047]
MTDKKTYPVLSAVRHNGTLYKPDDPEHDSITLTEKEANQLLKLKVIGEPAHEDTDEATGSEPSLSDEERKRVIINVLPQLKSDTDLTKAGEPKVSVIEKLVGFDVSADEVKAIWADVQAQSAALKVDPQSE